MSIPQALLVKAVRFYQRWISPLHAPCCRYYPSCSEYALEAIRIHGGVRGGYLALKRLMRCHPFTQGGYDPVPVSHRECRDQHG